MRFIVTLICILIFAGATGAVVGAFNLNPWNNIYVDYGFRFLAVSAAFYIAARILKRVPKKSEGERE